MIFILVCHRASSDSVISALVFRKSRPRVGEAAVEGVRMGVLKRCPGRLNEEAGQSGDRVRLSQEIF